MNNTIVATVKVLVLPITVNLVAIAILVALLLETRSIIVLSKE